METLFPFGFPLATAFYLTVYVLTLVVHWFFMHYVLAGTGYLALVHPVSSGSSRSERQARVVGVLTDWMPFGIGAAITAGVAPVLFVQIVYQQQFYSANLLLFHRWMSIVPVLIVGFYLAYLLRTPRIKRSGWFVRVGVALLAFLCFGWTAWSWTENHLLSVSQSTWPEFYGAERMMFRTVELAPRLLLWCATSVPTMCLIVAWQTIPRSDGPEARSIARHLALLAGVGGAAMVLCAIWYASLIAPDIRAKAFGSLGGPYLIAALGGVLLQCVGWVSCVRRPEQSTRWLICVSLGIALTLLGLAVAREALRIVRVDLTTLQDHHAEAFRVGGFRVFLTFAVVNAFVIAWSVQIVRRRLARGV